jgi:hypothetical protein
LTELDSDRTLAEGRHTPATSELDGYYECALEVPEDSIRPLVTAVGLLVVVLGVLFGWYWVAGLGGLLAAGTIAGWLWPPERTPEEAGVRS